MTLTLFNRHVSYDIYSIPGWFAVIHLVTGGVFVNRYCGRFLSILSIVLLIPPCSRHDSEQPAHGLVATAKFMRFVCKPGLNFPKGLARIPPLPGLGRRL